LRFAELAAQILRQAPLDAAQLQQHRGQRLPDLVVQLLRDAQPLRLVRREDAARGLLPLLLEPGKHLVERQRQLAGLGRRLGFGDALAGAGEVDAPRERVQRLQRRHGSAYEQDVDQRDQRQGRHEHDGLADREGRDLARREDEDRHEARCHQQQSVARHDPLKQG